MKLTERKFAIPMLGIFGSLINDGAGLGWDFKTMVLVVAGTLIYSAIETFHDIAKMKYGKANGISAEPGKTLEITAKV